MAAAGPHQLAIEGGVTCGGVDQAAFLRDGFAILRGVVPEADLQPVRDAYELLLDQQRAVRGLRAWCLGRIRFVLPPHIRFTPCPRTFIWRLDF
jgi:hypothetical protein